MTSASFVEFFAGVGLVREGLDGWRCLWANDISASKMETYVANFGEGDFHLGDIWEVAQTPSAVPDRPFLYTASFPCTDLSLAGDRKGLAGKESGAIHALIKILHEKSLAAAAPSVILLENVQGFLTSNQGKDVAWTVKALNELGYTVDIFEVDAVHFVPQSRPRVFVLAVSDLLAKETMIESTSNFSAWMLAINAANSTIRSKKIIDVMMSYSSLKWGAVLEPPQLPKRTASLKDIIDERSPQAHAWWPEEKKSYLASQMSDLHKRTLNDMIKDDHISYGTIYRRVRAGVTRAELRTDGVAGCLRTPRGGSSKQILIKAGAGQYAVRLMTPREYARLQGVRDDFVMPENPNQGYFAMGDAVCVPVIHFLSQHILKRLHHRAKRLGL